MFCSVIIPTIGRDSLTRAVNSVLEQSAGSLNLEVIVVNDAGQPLADEPWLLSEQIRVINTNHRERCVSRNTGAAIARGKYLWFLDDDDWLLPGAIETFLRLAAESKEAAWLYGGIRVVEESGMVLGEENSGLNGDCLAPVLGGAWVPIQSSLVRQDIFFQVGGFDPHIIGTEDLDLCVRIAAIGRFANATEKVACLFRGGSWETSTDYLRAPQDVRISRNRLLGEKGISKRIVKSARSNTESSYWFGRVVRVYSSSIVFNLRTRRLFTAVSRTLYCVLMLVTAGPGVATSAFWHGVKAHHVPGTLHFISQKYEQSSGRNNRLPVNEENATQT